MIMSAALCSHGLVMTAWIMLAVRHNVQETGGHHILLMICYRPEVRSVASYSSSVPPWPSMPLPSSIFHFWLGPF